MNHTYRKGWIFSFCLHGALLLLLTLNWVGSSKTYTVDAKRVADVQVVNATAVDNQTLQQTMAQIRNQEAQKAANLKAQQAALQAAQQKSQEARAAQAQAQKQLKAMQAQQAALAAQLKQQQQALAEAQAQKLAAQKAAADAREAQKAANQKKADANPSVSSEKEASNTDKLQQQLDKAQKDSFASELQSEQKQLQNANSARLASAQIDKYKALIIQAISQNWIVPNNASPDLNCVLHITLAPGGVVTRVSVVKSSGDSGLDNSAMAAVYKASPLPVPSDPDQFEPFKDLNLTVRPVKVIGG